MINNFMLAAVDFTNFVARIQKPHVIVGLILAVLGFATILLARRIASVARREENKDKPVESDNKVYILLKAVGLVMLLVALIILVFDFNSKKICFKRCAEIAHFYF